MPRRHKKMKKGGFLGFGESTPTDSGSSMFGSIGSTLSGWGSSISDSASSAYNKTKNAVTGSSSSSYAPPPPPPPPTPATSSSGYMGGRMSRRKRSRKMRGGYGDNIALTGLAASSAPISDIKSAQPLTTVGGRRTKRRHGGKHRHGKSCKTRRH
jgi:hypothetical protein